MCSYKAVLAVAVPDFGPAIVLDGNANVAAVLMLTSSGTLAVVLVTVVVAVILTVAVGGVVAVGVTVTVSVVVVAVVVVGCSPDAVSAKVAGIAAAAELIKSAVQIVAVGTRAAVVTVTAPDFVPPLVVDGSTDVAPVAMLPTHGESAVVLAKIAAVPVVNLAIAVGGVGVDVLGVDIGGCSPTAVSAEAAGVGPAAADGVEVAAYVAVDGAAESVMTPAVLRNVFAAEDADHFADFVVMSPVAAPEFWMISLVAVVYNLKAFVFPPDQQQKTSQENHSFQVPQFS